MTKWTHIDDAKPPSRDMVWVSDGVLVEFGEYSDKHGLWGFGDLGKSATHWYPIAEPAPPVIQPEPDDPDDLDDPNDPYNRTYTYGNHFDSL